MGAEATGAGVYIGKTRTPPAMTEVTIRFNNKWKGMVMARVYYDDEGHPEYIGDSIYCPAGKTEATVTIPSDAGVRPYSVVAWWGSDDTNIVYNRTFAADQVSVDICFGCYSVGPAVVSWILFSLIVLLLLIAVAWMLRSSSAAGSAGAGAGAAGRAGAGGDGPFGGNL